MKILIAEDDPISARLLRHMLETAGHDVLTAEDGRQALAVIVEHGIRMVISDWMMPGLDGPGLCREIRKNEGGGYVFVILLTSKSEKADIVAGLDAGADDFLTKPCHQSELMARLGVGQRILALEKSLQEAAEKIHELSIRDALTGCYNRRYMDEHLEAELRRAERYGCPLALVLCDIDHFKRVNDTHGHPAGDAILSEFAVRLLSTVRADIDWVVRYGGEEFVAVLPETGIPDGLRMAERLRRTVADRRFRTDSQEIDITASFGVSGVGSDFSDGIPEPGRLLKEADDALYLAKSGGRNRVVAATSADTRAETGVPFPPEGPAAQKKTGARSGSRGALTPNKPGGAAEENTLNLDY